MQRIFLPDVHFGNILTVSEKELYHQITRVLRARVGQQYIFFDGVKLQDSIYEIREIDATKVVFILKESVEKSAEVFSQLYLYQALPNKLEKLEYIIQKSCEVGYSRITFFQAERSQILQLSDNKRERLKKIAIESIEQCGGNIIPEIIFFDNSGFLFEDEKIKRSGISCFCHTQKDEDSQNLDVFVDSEDKQYSIYIGPEGGWTTNEIEYMKKIGIIPVCFGNRIFRTETVASCIGFYISQKKEI